eukprot:m.56378 g.56378  ORF g.56378 m.56378 type:complete len:386 (-) comp13385_c0_seq2:409-1566(-)
MKVSALVLVLAAVAGLCSAEHCKMPQNAYPPPAANALRWVDINLDDDPLNRWTAVVQPMSKQILDMINSVVELLPAGLRAKLMQRLDKRAPELVAAMPYPYNQEILGISQATGIDLGLLFLYNVAYELEGVCTSIVAQNTDGSVYHARNLDFGLFLGIDKANQSWRLTEKLRPLLFNARFLRGGQNIYNATYYAGYVGLLTGAKKAGFSISVDTRFDDNLDEGLIKWMDGDTSGSFLSLLTRSVMENNATYEDAYTTLNAVKMIGPSYIILGGYKPAQGAVITREEAKSLFPWTLQMSLNNGSFFVLETNYDHWTHDPFYDDRRTPAEKCLNEVTAANISPEKLFNVLSGRPNLNMLTTYTTIMDVASGRFEAYLQFCEWPCAPW